MNDRNQMQDEKKWEQILLKTYNVDTDRAEKKGERVLSLLGGPGFSLRILFWCTCPLMHVRTGQNKNKGPGVLCKVTYFLQPQGVGVEISNAVVWNTYSMASLGPSLDVLEVHLLCWKSPKKLLTSWSLQGGHKMLFLLWDTCKAGVLVLARI